MTRVLVKRITRAISMSAFPPTVTSIHGDIAVPGSVSEHPSERPPGWTIACISDTHGKHISIDPVPPADVLIHAGDFSNTGTVSDVKNFTEWFDGLPHRHKIFIAGNHDTTFEKSFYLRRGNDFHRPNLRGGLDLGEYSDLCRSFVHSMKSSVYLEDSSCRIPFPDQGPESGVLVFGSPWQPEFCDWAFNLDRGQPLIEKWSQIPDETDVLITHGPPFGFGDLCSNGFNSGCEDLLRMIQMRERPPRVHIFGHIHEAFGVLSLQYIISFQFLIIPFMQGIGRMDARCM
jgi:hypothetical protein